MGTHEKFLVCDRSLAMIGSHNFLTSDCHSSERELGLITKDKNIIEDCIRRFEDAPSLDNRDSLNHKKHTRKVSVKRSERIIIKTQSSQK
nr:phospholipase D-like domain-containing protein [Hyella patelloides]